MATLIIFPVTCLAMVISVIFFPKLKFGRKFSVDTYWIVTMVGAILTLALGGDAKAVGEALISDSAINPLKILALFISMTILSIYLDELGFFRYLASVALKKAKSGQKKLFLMLYITVSILTVFTSNDIIILSFTPFICYFAKNAKINPTPYLVAEFVAANTWSMALIIGNPTNIYLATAFEIDFLSYLEVSLLPTIFAGGAALIMLYLLFHKHLSQPIEGEAEDFKIEDKPLLITGAVHLGVCTVLLAISSYIGIEMWIVALAAVGSLFLITLLICAIRKSALRPIWHSLSRAPYQLIPFLLSMFVMIVALSEEGVSQHIAEFFGSNHAIVKYGVSSFLAANVINNIPMSVFFSSIIGNLSGKTAIEAVYATIVGSNIGAFLTPIGALAGIMWRSILVKQGIRFSVHDFLKMGLFIAVPTLFAAIAGLYAVSFIF